MQRNLITYNMHGANKWHNLISPSKYVLKNRQNSLIKLNALPTYPTPLSGFKYLPSPCYLSFLSFFSSSLTHKNKPPTPYLSTAYHHLTLRARPTPSFTMLSYIRNVLSITLSLSLSRTLPIWPE